MLADAESSLIINTSVQQLLTTTSGIIATIIGFFTLVVRYFFAELKAEKADYKISSDSKDAKFIAAMDLMAARTDKAQEAHMMVSTRSVEAIQQVSANLTQVTRGLTEINERLGTTTERLTQIEYKFKGIQ